MKKGESAIKLNEIDFSKVDDILKEIESNGSDMSTEEENSIITAVHEWCNELRKKNSDNTATAKQYIQLINGENMYCVSNPRGYSEAQLINLEDARKCKRDNVSELCKIAKAQKIQAKYDGIISREKELYSALNSEGAYEAESLATTVSELSDIQARNKIKKLDMENEIRLLRKERLSVLEQMKTSFQKSIRIKNVEKHMKYMANLHNHNAKLIDDTGANLILCMRIKDKNMRNKIKDLLGVKFDR